MTRRTLTRTAVALASAAALVAAACERESRRYNESPARETKAETIALTNFHAGGAPPPPSTEGVPDLQNAYAISEGKRLFSAYNCAGCHANGGGGIGPALTDDRWIYGNTPRQVYSSILQGRPDGMPSFDGKIPGQQMWQIVAFVESLSGGGVPADARPGRNDDLSSHPPETRMPPLAPRQTGHR